MASWRRVLVFFRKVPWSSQPPKVPPQLRAAGAGLLASALAAGSVAYYGQRVAGGALPLTVYADEQKASKGRLYPIEEPSTHQVTSSPLSV